MKNKLLMDWYESIQHIEENKLDFSKKKLLVITQENFEKLPEDQKYQVIIINNKLNFYPRINKLLIKCNNLLEEDGYLIGYSETISTRKYRLQEKYGFGYTVCEICDIVLYRILPNISYSLFDSLHHLLFKKTSFKIRRIISKAEVLGRLVYCGFKIQNIEDKSDLYFFVKKEGKPLRKKNRSYELFFKMDRIGKDGKLIGVYKMRTMYPYSEFIQEYIMQTNGLSENGKIKDDYRIPRWGKFFRKYWIDELPMFLNVLKGDLKLYGVRPVSQEYFNLFPKELQELRKKTKPGLIPPIGDSFDQVVEGEIKYLREYIDSPIKTDIKYFFQTFVDIIVRKKRSS